jgi:pimeloyl-ACP methyl ester carboxylesterase
MSERALRGGEIEVGGVRSPLLYGGPDAAEEAVVFVHGAGGSCRDWERLGATVSEWARVVAPDLPAFGGADKPRDFEYTIDGYARHLDGVIKALGIRRAHLVMHDFGGPFGLCWAAAHPGAVASLTMFSVGVMLGYKWHGFARILRAPLLGELFQATATRFMFHAMFKRGNPRGIPPEYIDRMYEGSRGYTKKAVLSLYRTSDLAARGAEWAPALRAAAPPALVIWGKHDLYVPYQYAERQREIFPEARVVVLEESGHWPFIDDPAAVEKAVVPFLRRQLRAE